MVKAIKDKINKNKYKNTCRIYKKVLSLSIGNKATN